MSRSFADVIAQAKAEQQGWMPDNPEETHARLAEFEQQEEVPSVVGAEPSLDGLDPALAGLVDRDYGAALDGGIPDEVVEEYLRRKEQQRGQLESATIQPPYPYQQPSNGSGMSVGRVEFAPQSPQQREEPSLIPMLMQQNAQLQQQVAQLTQQLMALTERLTSGGVPNGQPRQQIRGDQMSEQQRWAAMHGDAGLLG